LTGDPYRLAGVDYDVLDSAKRRSLEGVLATVRAATRNRAQVDQETIGEPAQVFEVGGLRLATVLECLGTKSTICREVERSLGIDRWSAIGVDAVAAIVNDLCCVGALPLVVSAYLATGDAQWYLGPRHGSFVEGWQRACEESGAMWVGGESPTLSGIVEKGSVDIAGSAVGLVQVQWLGSRIEPGDEIVVVSSSGLHANGASLARKVAEQTGWEALLPSGKRFGEAVLEPSVLYARLVGAVVESGADVHYASHITGHGWRKVMRPDRELTYRITHLPDVPEVLGYLADRAGLGPAAAYGTFNMGAGFALYVTAGSGRAVVALAEAAGYSALVAGKVERGPRQVILEPIGVTYSTEELELR
jgi:phosphoribosylformylglycinamidine cyclo-ligase